MKVCVDIQAAIAQRAGVGRYARMLVEHLAPLAGKDELALFYFDFKRSGVPFPVPGAEQQAVQWCPGRIVQKAWKTMGWPPFDWFAGRADIYHFPNFILPPLTRGRTAVTIHDVAFLRHPEAAEKRNLKYLNSRIADTVKRADAILTDSHFSAREITELLKVPPEKLYPVHLGLSPDMKPASQEDIEKVRNLYGLQKPFLLTVGTLEPRKNIPFLIDVFERLADFDGDLVIAGMKGWSYEPILARMRASKQAERIRYLEYVEDGLLSALYSGAELFVFPTIYEGFGFPPLEAMACGTPVVSSNAGPLPELLGSAAALVDGYLAGEWVEMLSGVLRDELKRNALRAKGLDQSAKFDWSKTAAETWKIYRKIIRG